jgi:hypothetical protein
VDLATSYPTCASFVNGTDPEAVSSVAATFAVGDAANTGAALNVVFGMALWVSLALHAFGVELYLHLTPKEAQRLRQISYQRQLEAGLRNPGSAGLTTDRLGDAEKWVPETSSKDSTSMQATEPTEPNMVAETK